MGYRYLDADEVVRIIYAICQEFQPPVTDNREKDVTSVDLLIEVATVISADRDTINVEDNARRPELRSQCAVQVLGRIRTVITPVGNEDFHRQAVMQHPSSSDATLTIKCIVGRAGSVIESTALMR